MSSRQLAVAIVFVCGLGCSSTLESTSAESSQEVVAKSGAKARALRSRAPGPYSIGFNLFSYSDKNKTFVHVQTGNFGVQAGTEEHHVEIPGSIEGCLVTHFPPSSNTNEEPVLPVNAGTVDFKMGDHAFTFPFSETPPPGWTPSCSDCNGWDGYGTETLARVRGGETYSWTVRGDGLVPARTFQGIVPTPVTLTTPLPTLIDRSQPLQIAWTSQHPVSASVTNGVLVRFGNEASDGSFVSVSCGFPTASLQATIPTSVLAELPKGTAGYVGVQDAAVAVERLSENRNLYFETLGDDTFKDAEIR